MHYKIEEIEGVGPSYGEKLREAGIARTGQMLEACGTAKGRKQVAAATGLSEALLLKWVNLADLMRITGIGKQFSELLEAVGVDTVKELKHRNAENLAITMKELNAVKHLTRATPSSYQVVRWVDQAKNLAPAITH